MGGKMEQWLEELKKFDSRVFINVSPTHEEYASIRRMGLSTVEWQEYTCETLLNEIDTSAKTFIENNNPCLFIYDPRVPGLKKSFLTKVYDVKTISEWIKSHKSELKNYNYLLTTEITNHADGFVGIARSDGKGKLMVTTLHYPGINIQSEATRPSKDYTGYWNYLTIDECRTEIEVHPAIDPAKLKQEDIPPKPEIYEKSASPLWASTSNLLKPSFAREIADLYLERDGYFEFVNGWQHGIRGTYTTGYEQGIFPLDELIHRFELTDVKARMNGMHLRYG